LRPLTGLGFILAVHCLDSADRVIFIDEQALESSHRGTFRARCMRGMLTSRKAMVLQFSWNFCADKVRLLAMVNV
jgi:hypothetical protein